MLSNSDPYINHTPYKRIMGSRSVILIHMETTLWDALVTKSANQHHQWLLPLLFTFLLPLLSLLTVLIVTRRRPEHNNTVTNTNLPPGPLWFPIIGNLHNLGKAPHLSLFRLSQTYGPLMLLHLAGIPTLVVSSAAAARDVLKTHDRDFCHRPSTYAARRFTYNNSDIAFSLGCSPLWRDMRRVLLSELVGAQSLWSARKAQVSRMLRTLGDAASQARAVDVNHLVLDIVQGITEVAAFGRYLDEDKRFGEIMKEAMRVIVEFSGEDYFPRVGWVIDAFTGHRRRVERCFQSLDSHFQEVIDAHLDPTRTESQGKDLVDELVGLWKKGEISVHRLKGILWDTFIGGTDTTAATIIWAMTELIKSPRTMSKAQAEIRAHIGNKPNIEPDDLTELEYLKMVIKETLRLHPPAPLLIPHEAIRHCVIGSGDDRYDISPGTRVLVSPYAIGRDPKIWADPLVFYPERFEQKEIDFEGRHFELIPFGSGRRICPGISMGVATLEFLLANLLCWFDWELPNGMTNRDDVNMDEESGLVIRKKTPLRLVPITYPK